jgi:diguanylate cyclase (GGDEF)-like protein/PAS domain S-box-containing protein
MISAVRHSFGANSPFIRSSRMQQTGSVLMLVRSKLAIMRPLPFQQNFDVSVRFGSMLVLMMLLGLQQVSAEQPVITEPGTTAVPEQALPGLTQAGESPTVTPASGKVATSRSSATIKSFDIYDVLQRYWAPVLTGAGSLAVILAGLLISMLRLNKRLKTALANSHHLHRDLKRTTETLEARVAERTGELTLRTEVLDLISQGRSLDTILISLARLVESRHPGTVCVILLLEADQTYRTYGTIKNLPNCYRQLSRSSNAKTQNAAIDHPVFVNDVLQLSWWKPFRMETRTTGLRACWAQPILNHDKEAIGSVSLFHRQPKKPPNGAESAQLEDYARLSFLAVDHDRTDMELRIAATAFDTQDGVYVTNADRVIIRINEAACDITGYSREEALGQTPRLFRSDKHDDAFFKDMYEAIANQGYWRGEIWNRRKNGVVYPQWQTITAVKTPDGAITHYVAAFTDITAHKMAEDQIRHLAFYDSLTRLPNRRLLIDRLEKALIATARTKRHGALMFLDLDNFKTLNDTHSHEMGDLLLIEVGRRLQECVRAKDTVARLGGDEFLVMMDDLDENSASAAIHAATVAEKIRNALAKPYVLTPAPSSHAVGTIEHQCTPSIGVTLFNDHEGSSAEYLKRADLAMYQAKSAGKNAIRFFDPAMQRALANRTELAEDLRQAIDQGQLQLLYQVQVDAEKTPIGAEAFIRWDHPLRGAIPPSEFIPLAEETGLAIGLSQWVLKTACRHLSDWAYHPEMRHLQLAINISARQFRQPDFVNSMRTAVAETGVNSNKLLLEITENIVLEDIDEAITKIGLLKAIGVRFVMDDFGTGYSSLSYLQRLPIDQVKIDGSFIRKLPDHIGDAAIVRTIIALSRNLGLHVVAEGVETEAQRVFLVSKGCNYFQGYLFGKPVEERELVNYVQARLTS